MDAKAIETTAGVEKGVRERAWGLIGRRWRYLVPGGLQPRAILGICGLAFLLLAILDFLIYRLQNNQALALLQVAPELAALIHGQDTMEMGFVIATSLTALLAVAVVVLFESHKYAGPIYNLMQTMQRVGERQGSSRAHFRKGDHLPGLETSFNAMIDTLESRAHARADEVERISIDLRRAAAAVGGSASTDLHLLADDLDRMMDDISRP